jgi:hypothetical protein
MKNSIIFLVFIFFTFCFSAQTENKDVTITATGSGSSQEFAKQTALRNAIEQAFGTFISSKTEILNDEIVADQMSSVSSGNVKSYEVLNESQLPNGTWASTLRVIVSVDKLTSFVEAKGITVEIKGGLFALNIKQQLLNEQGEINAISEMVGVLHEPMQSAFDYTIKSEDPKSKDAESKNWEIPLTVTAKANKNMEFCANYFIKILSALSLSQAEIQTYKSLNKEVFKVIINYNGIVKDLNFRNQKSLNIIYSFASNWEFYTRLFTVKSGIDSTYGLGYGNKHNFYYYRYNNNTLQINFLNSNQEAATFSWKDDRTLTQIEKMDGYSVFPRGIVSSFKHGGFVVFEENGHGLVVNVYTLWDFNHEEAIRICDELHLNGYNDWTLPTIEQLRIINRNLAKQKIGGFESPLPQYSSVYWSLKDDEGCVITRDFKPMVSDDSDNEESEYYGWEFKGCDDERLGQIKNNVRAVRTF